MPDEIRMHLAKTLLAMRTLRGLTHAELAERSHLSEDCLRGIELGERDVSVGALELLAMGLDCRVEDLLSARLRRLLLRHLITRAEHEAALMQEAAAMTVAPEAQRWLVTTPPKEDDSQR